MTNLKLGQSIFQDTFFVAGSQETPYRQLRQIDLEIRSIEGALKQAEFDSKRHKITLARLNPEDEMEAIDIEELQWNISRQKQLQEEMVERHENFKLIREQLLSRVPSEYWDNGFENAELEYWTLNVAKQISMAKAIGVPPSSHIMEMLSQLPQNAQFNVMKIANTQAMKMVSMDHEVHKQLVDELQKSS